MPHCEALRLQCRADVLLLLQWDKPSEAGDISGELFQYLGARRPVLALGYEAGKMAAIVRDRAAGLFANDPEEIARQLAAWRQEKRQTGRIAALPESARAGFAREEQFAELVRFFGEVMAR